MSAVSCDCIPAISAVLADNMARSEEMLGVSGGVSPVVERGDAVVESGAASFVDGVDDWDALAIFSSSSPGSGAS